MGCVKSGSCDRVCDHTALEGSEAWGENVCVSVCVCVFGGSGGGRAGRGRRKRERERERPVSLFQHRPVVLQLPVMWPQLPCRCRCHGRIPMEIGVRWQQVQAGNHANVLFVSQSCHLQHTISC